MSIIEKVPGRGLVLFLWEYSFSFDKVLEVGDTLRSSDRRIPKDGNCIFILIILHLHCLSHSRYIVNVS